MLILGIETSCDETSIAIVKDGKEVLSNYISSQIAIHKEYGGVVPEIASRHHIKNIATILEESLEQAKVTLDDIDYIGVTYSPGLIGALLVGVSFAKGLSYGKNIPLVPVHHIKGHIYANLVENDVEFPCIALVVSGGHTNIIYIDENHNFTNLGGTLDDAVGESYDKVARVLGIGYPGGPVIDKHTNIIYIDENHNFTNLGGTLDDAVGESYDKVARVLGIGYPGGPVIDKMYYEGNPDFLKITEPKVDGYNFAVGESYDKVARVLGIGYPGGPVIDKMYYEGNPDFLKITEPKVDGYNFSFSGIKTAVINYVNKMKMKGEEFAPVDLAASFQGTVVDILCKKVLKACADKNVKQVIIAGGVAANSLLRSELKRRGAEQGVEVSYPSMKLCTEACADKNVKQVIIAGGVAANSLLRSELKRRGAEQGVEVSYPSMKLCTDNGAMIAAAAYYKLKKGYVPEKNLNLNGIATLPIDKEIETQL